MTAANKLLPIGSIVLLREASKKLMVIGILPRNEENVYDYIGVLYPEGYMSQESMFLFNHDDIATVEYLGFVNSEHQTFRVSLADYMRNTEAQQ